MSLLSKTLEILVCFFCCLTLQDWTSSLCIQVWDTYLFLNWSCGFHILIQLYHLWLNKKYHETCEKNHSIWQHSVISPEPQEVFPMGGVSQGLVPRSGFAVPMQSTRHVPGSGSPNAFFHLCQRMNFNLKGSKDQIPSYSKLHVSCLKNHSLFSV